MSLIKKLWIAIIIIMAFTFSANMIVNTLSIKHTLQKQLEMKNIDNAVSLALSISQMEKDPVVIDLMLSAQFDNGHYQYIKLTDSTGKLLTERKNTHKTPDVPTWFSNLIHISAPPGVALIQNGWSQYGTLSLESTTEFAYNDLWSSTLSTLFWSIIIAAVMGLIGTIMLKRILKPLSEMVHLAEAIADQNFISIDEPNTFEFKTLAKAMNRLSQRIKKMFKEQSLLLEELRLEANYDAVTRLMNRKYFINRISTTVANEEVFHEGALVITHINNLAEINKRIGGAETDALLKSMGNAIQAMCHESNTLIAGRLTGADFAVFSNTPVDQHTLETQIKNILEKQNIEDGFDLSTTSHKISKEDKLEGLNQLVSTNKENPTPDEANIIHLINQNHTNNYENSDEVEWRNMLNTALDTKRLKLAEFPVQSTSGELIHNESPVRLQLEENGNWLSAADFISWAIKLNLITRIDDQVLEFAVNSIANGSQPIGLNVSTGAMRSKVYIKQLAALLKSNPKAAQHLWLEVPEDGVFNHLEEFRYFCKTLKPLGCKIGVEHVGAQISRLGELHDLGLDYIKIDASLIRNINNNTGNQAFLKGLCLIAHSIGLIAIAEGVQNNSELSALPALGIDAATGPAVRN
jgi:EAL domain-containing protein (putative c-di-GMP-specific phosphodiesterase class I)/GGDEF domain-containing protein